MKSKTSFFNKTIYKKNLSRFWSIPCLYFLFLFWLLPFILYTEGARMTMEKLPEADYIPNMILYIARGCSPVYIGCAAIVATLAVFSYLYKNSSATYMHAFPVKRNTIFFTNVCSILTMLEVPHLLIALISTGVLSMHHATGAIWAIWYWFVILTLYTLCFMGIALCTATISGQLITNFFFYWVFNFMFLAGEMIVRTLFSLLYFGMSGNYAYESKLDMFSPIAYLSSNGGFTWAATGYHITEKGIVASCIYALAGIGFCVIAYYLYKKKSLETAEDFITIPVMKYVFSIGVSFFTAIFLAMLLCNTLADAFLFQHLTLFLLLFILSIVFFAVVFFVTQMLIHRQFRVFNKSTWKQCGCFCILLAIFFLLIEFDVTGTQKKVPDTSDIELVHVDLSNKDYILTSPDDIAAIAQVHTSLVSECAQIRDARDTAYVYLTLSYRLKDGNVFERRYRLCGASSLDATYEKTCQQLLQILNQTELIKTQLIAPNYEQLSVLQLEVYLSDSVGEANTAPAYSDEERSKVYQALLKDISQGNFQPVTLDKEAEYYTIPLNLFFQSPTPIRRTANICDYLTYSGGITSSSKAEAEFLEKEWMDYYYLTPSCVHTLKALKDIGAIENENQLEPRTFQEAFMVAF